VGNFSKYLKDEGAKDIGSNYYSTTPNFKSSDNKLRITMLACNYPTVDYKDPNDRSIVLLFQWEGFKILMTGDATAATEKQILKRFDTPTHKNLLAIDVTKVPHHGSETSSSVAFVDVTRPSFAMVSADNNPGYKLPRASILKRYDKYLGTNKNAHFYVAYNDAVSVSDFEAGSTKKDLYTTLEGLLQGVQWELKFGSDGTITTAKA
jgi:hypothetical protein